MFRIFIYVMLPGYQQQGAPFTSGLNEREGMGIQMWVTREEWIGRSIPNCEAQREGVKRQFGNSLPTLQSLLVPLSAWTNKKSWDKYALMWPIWVRIPGHSIEQSETETQPGEGRCHLDAELLDQIFGRVCREWSWRRQTRKRGSPVLFCFEVAHYSRCCISSLGEQAWGSQAFHETWSAVAVAQVTAR